jgi:formate/nitrite transporter FocA (FNT family)
MTQREHPLPAVTASPQDAYPPAQIARLVGEIGVRKAAMPAIEAAMLGMLAGAFIAFGAMYYTLVTAGTALEFGPARLLGGLAFSLGLILVVVGGAELFTGNSLVVMAWAERKITTLQLLGCQVAPLSLVAVCSGAGGVGTARCCWTILAIANSCSRSSSPSRA